MKARLLFTLAFFSFSAAAFSQDMENDDMYFNAKDRAALKAARASEANVYASVRTEKPKTSVESDEDAPLNPTDSYSARNVNPEFAARSKADVARSDDENYFSSDYHYNTRSDLNSWNNNFNSQYDNSWYQNSYWTPGMYGWNSPYYGNYYGGYDPWANLWYSPYSRPGWNSSISFSYGNAWNYGYSGWSMSHGYGYGYGSRFGFGNPYNSYWYNPYAAWGGGPYWGGYPQVVVVERGPRAYGKRNSRSSSVHPGMTNSGGGRPIVSTSSGRSETSGRTSSNASRQTTTSRTQSEYYNRSWRNQPSVTTSSDDANTNTGRSNSSYNNSNSRPRTTPTRSNTKSTSSWNSGNNDSNSSPSYTPNRSSNSTPSYTPSRSSGNNSSGSSGRSSGSSSGSSSGNSGRSRGR